MTLRQRIALLTRRNAWLEAELARVRDEVKYLRELMNREDKKCGS